MAGALVGAAQAAAADVTVQIENLRSGEGTVLVAICTPEGFLGMDCTHHARTKARPGTAEVTVAGVRPGAYAVQAIHDENNNSELDRTIIGLPREGMAISRDAPMHMGPPRFADAVVRIGEGGGSITLHMRYF